ncbi:hypothetical protein [Mesorhizobium sp. M0058]|uniref:hypothetical protein n=1 Tax=Mesorhizobium sp. M0058 TaxID=2956865 RepID=UPI003337C984
MLRQYRPQRFRYETIGGVLRHVGTIPIGTIFRSTRLDPRFTRKLIVEAWLPREIGAGRVRNGRYENTFAVGGHLAQVRDLSNGRRFMLADHFIRFCVDHD